MWGDFAVEYTSISFKHSSGDQTKKIEKQKSLEFDDRMMAWWVRGVWCLFFYTQRENMRGYGQFRKNLGYLRLVS
jgi:hypothetical protein